jgi:hypothetical protein
MNFKKAFPLGVLILLLAACGGSSGSSGSQSVTPPGQSQSNIYSAAGTYTDGQTVTLTGSGFGANNVVGTAALEFLGGSSGPIESGTAGASFSRSRWTVDTGWGGDIVYNTANSIFGSKCLYTVMNPSFPEVPLYYSFPSAVGTSDHLFVSWWQRTVWTGNGQYKILRLSPTETIVDGTGQQAFFFHNNAGWVTFGPTVDSGTMIYPSFSPASPINNWTRFDLDISTSSSASGSVTMTKYTPGSSLQTLAISNYRTHFGSSWNYLIWQNYFGTDAYGNMTSGSTWVDDVYISHGSRARVELCDSSTWSGRRKCIIQPPVSWSDSSISIVLNQGDFSSGSTAYLYVVDSSGDVVGTGYPITLQ